MRTTSGFAPRERFVDREEGGFRPRWQANDSNRRQANESGDRVANRWQANDSWAHPQEPPSRRPVTPREPGERFVDTEFFSDDPVHEDAGGAPQLRRGARVMHAHFGKGEILSVGKSNLGEPSVVAFFPGWGEKRSSPGS